MAYHNGPVLHSERQYLYFWAPAGHTIPSTYRFGLGNFVNEVAAGDYTGGEPFSVAQQYYDLSGPGGAKRFVPYGVTNGGTLIDTHAYPTSGCSDTDNGQTLSVCLTQAQIVSELSGFIAAHHLPRGLGVQYYMLTPHGIGSCFDGTSNPGSCAYTGYCAWHAHAGSGTGLLVYGYVPWAYQTSGCDPNVAFGTGYPNGDAVDPAVGMLGREMTQTMTDPEANAWYDAAGFEVGDKCSFLYGPGGFGSTTGLPNNGLGYFNRVLGGDDYLLNSAFDNHSLDCRLGSSFTQPTMSVGPGTAAHKISRLFTAHVTDPSGVAYVVWNFGDGTATATTTATSVHHTYRTSGHRTLVVVATDKQGNTVRVLRPVTVS